MVFSTIWLWEVVAYTHIILIIISFRHSWIWLLIISQFINNNNEPNWTLNAKKGKKKKSLFIDRLWSKSNGTMSNFWANYIMVKIKILMEHSFESNISFVFFFFSQLMIPLSLVLISLHRIISNKIIDKKLRAL